MLHLTGKEAALYIETLDNLRLLEDRPDEDGFKSVLKAGYEFTIDCLKKGMSTEDIDQAFLDKAKESCYWPKVYKNCDNDDACDLGIEYFNSCDYYDLD